jgi:hypothetical protein
MILSGRIVINGIYYNFDTWENLIDQLRENNQLEEFLDIIDYHTGRARR